MKQKASAPRVPVRDSTDDTSSVKDGKNTDDAVNGNDPQPPASAVQHDTYTGRVGGILSVASARRLSTPPRRAFRSNDGVAERGLTEHGSTECGRTEGATIIYEDLVLVGSIEAPRATRNRLELYGIDMSCAQYNRVESRWEGCLFSEQVADMLVELVAEGEFPFAFKAVPSWAELEWQVRKARGEKRRPDLDVYMFVEPASMEAIEVFQQQTGISLVRRGTPREAAGPSATGDGTSELSTQGDETGGDKKA